MIHIASHRRVNYEIAYVTNKVNVNVVYVYSTSSTLVKTAYTLDFIFEGYKTKHIKALFPPMKEWNLNKVELPKHLYDAERTRALDYI